MPAANDRIHTFFILHEPDAPERIVVWDTQDVSIGRARENDIVIDNVEISRNHARFDCTGKSFVVRNLSTSNGTLVNGEEVSNHVLESGDVVSIAAVELRFYQSARDPVALGKPVQYASQLKDFPGATITASDGESTMLGLLDTLSGSDEVFEVRPANEFAYDLHGIEMGGHASEPRDLDPELADLRMDDLDAPEAALTPPPGAAAPRAAGTPEFLELDGDLPEEPVTTRLEIEIEGLGGELRRLVEAFAGKVIELPPLRLRIRADEGD